jgi:CheY-like chemotaxis protein/HPt (histidine-containing phosphotransfer) domain-containing protein
MDDIISKSSSMTELIGALQSLMENGNRHRPTHAFDEFSGKTILVADDDTYSRLVAKGYLERCGANVVEAEHGHAVLSRLQEHSAIDAIVIDMHMPGMGGLEATKSIRTRTDSYANVPIIALTSQSDIKAAQACLIAGMNEVMVKPVQVGALYAALSRQFARQRALRASLAADAVPEPKAPVYSFAPIEEIPLLDEKHLEELVTLDLLNKTLRSGIDQMRSTVTRLAASVADGDVGSAHDALHLLLGVSGNIGATALHQFTRPIYERLLDAEVFAEGDWLARICSLSDRSAEALETYFDAVKARRSYPRLPRSR